VPDAQIHRRRMSYVESPRGPRLDAQSPSAPPFLHDDPRW
jgi:hypothetical protein